jgi:hypothetical protein
VRFELANAADEPALRRLLRETPLDGEISVSLECEPSINFASGIQGRRTEFIVARSGGHGAVVAMGSRHLTECYVNGARRPVGYLGQLRVLQEHRGQGALLRGGFAALRRCHADGEAPFYLTTIVADNDVARRVLEAGNPGFPTYRFIGNVITHVLAARRAGRGPAGGIAAEAAGAGDVDEILACLARHGRSRQFAPCWPRDRLLSGVEARGLRIEDFLVVRRQGRIAGCMACWDQRAFKQTVIRRYSPHLAWARPFGNLVAGLTGGQRLPAVGEKLAMAFASHLAVDDDDPRTFSALMNGVTLAAAARGLDYISLGLSDTDPLMAELGRGFQSRKYPSRVYLVHWEDGRDDVRAIDGRPLHLEVAIL